jgi:hypothetical protein
MGRARLLALGPEKPEAAQEAKEAGRLVGVVPAQTRHPG